MKANDVRAKTDDELTGQLENTARFRQVRRDVARIKTILGERRRQTAQG